MDFVYEEAMSSCVYFVQQCYALAHRRGNADIDMHEACYLHARFVIHATRQRCKRLTTALLQLSSSSSSSSAAAAAQFHFAKQLLSKYTRADDAAITLLRTAVGIACVLHGTPVRCEDKEEMNILRNVVEDEVDYAIAMLNTHDEAIEQQALRALKDHIFSLPDSKDAAMRLCYALHQTLSSSANEANRMEAHAVKEIALSNLHKRDRLEAIKSLLHGGNSHPAAGALLLARLKRELQSAWENEGKDSPFNGPEPVSIAADCLRRAVDAVHVSEVEALADVIIGALNVIRFVCLRQCERSDDCMCIIARARQLESVTGAIHERVNSILDAQSTNEQSLALQNISLIASEAQSSLRKLIMQQL